jgi:hypothetical protein
MAWRVPSVVFACCILILAVAGCGTSIRGAASATAAASATPSPGERVIQQARTAHLVDATFTIAIVMNSTSSVNQEPPTSGSGTGMLTTQPKRTAVAYRLVSGAAVDDNQDIVDFATDTDYSKNSLLMPDSSKWFPVRMTASIFDVPTAPFAYLQLADATLIGSELVTGVAVWHVRGTLADRGETGVIDAYLQQDTYLPVRLVQHVTDASGTEVDTFVFTTVNTAVTIALPPPDQVQAP